MAKRATRNLKRAVFLAAGLPLALVAWRALGQHRTNPIADAENDLGLLTLILLLASLACTPLRIVTGAAWPVALRRMLGLFAAFYALLHFVTYLVVDQGLDGQEILRDIVKRRFITVGFAAFVTLVPLALTSTAGWVRRLGARRWKALHRLVYLAAVLAIVHFLWRPKVVGPKQLAFLSALLVLFAVRLLDAARRARAAGAARAAPGTSVR